MEHLLVQQINQRRDSMSGASGSGTSSPTKSAGSAATSMMNYFFSPTTSPKRSSLDMAMEKYSSPAAGLRGAYGFSTGPAARYASPVMLFRLRRYMCTTIIENLN